jgi:hypothetical protein
VATATETVAEAAQKAAIATYSVAVAIKLAAEAVIYNTETVNCFFEPILLIL